MFCSWWIVIVIRKNVSKNLIILTPFSVHKYLAYREIIFFPLVTDPLLDLKKSNKVIQDFISCKSFDNHWYILVWKVFSIISRMKCMSIVSKTLSVKYVFDVWESAQDTSTPTAANLTLSTILRTLNYTKMSDWRKNKKTEFTNCIF